MKLELHRVVRMIQKVYKMLGQHVSETRRMGVLVVSCRTIINSCWINMQTQTCSKIDQGQVLTQNHKILKWEF